MATKKKEILKTRIPDLLMHSKSYAFEGPVRLARDCGCSPSAVHRLIAGRGAPTHNLVCAVTRALEQELGRRIDPRDVVMDETGEWLTPNVCELVGCLDHGYGGCYPEYAYDEQDNLRPEFEAVRPGYWSLNPSLSREVVC